MLHFSSIATEWVGCQMPLHAKKTAPNSFKIWNDPCSGMSKDMTTDSGRLKSTEHITDSTALTTTQSHYRVLVPNELSRSRTARD